MTKHTRTKKLLAITLALGALGGGAAAIAGSRVSGETVWVDQTYRFAYGEVADARYSSDPTQYIGCQVQSWPSLNNGAPQLYCYAASSTYVYGNCTSYDPHLVQIGLGITGDSSMEFLWDANGNCTSLAVNKGSQYSGKVRRQLAPRRLGAGPLATRA